MAPGDAAEYVETSPMNSPPVQSPSRLTDVDPVCGMAVPADARWTDEFRGHTYHFCSRGCRDAFHLAPERYATEAGPRSPQVSTESGEGQEAPSIDAASDEEPGRTRGWSAYVPLLVIIATAAVVAAASSVGTPAGVRGTWMHGFMGVFLVVLAMFKFFDLSGFADGFQMYDLLAKRVRAYAYAYPVIELGLGLAYLAGWGFPGVYGATIAVMLFGSLGVLHALRRGLDVKCACMGTVLQVPLSTVALTEDLGMAAMAAALWTLSR